MSENVKVPGLSIAALVLGIVSLVSWCVWFISIPCAILALIFGILGIKKQGKGLALSGLITGAIALTIWAVVFTCAFISGIAEGISESKSYTKPNYSYSLRK